MGGGEGQKSKEKLPFLLWTPPSSVPRFRLLPFSPWAANSLKMNFPMFFGEGL